MSFAKRQGSSFFVVFSCLVVDWEEAEKLFVITKCDIFKKNPLNR